ncbi:MAG: oligosaccharide flippase family protein [Rhodobacteraceae bacterium]|nr:oligosaccharide flippase family protein [Paracoccaceae bacterium]
MSILKSSLLVSATSALNLVVRLLSLVVLARLLLPEHFGVVAMAFALQSMIAIIAQLDFRDALIQSRSISRAHVSWAWRGLTVTGLGCYAGLVLAGPWLEVLFGMPGFAQVLMVIALCLILQVLQAPVEALLIRRRQIRAVAMASVWGYALGFAGLGIALALAAPGAMALAWGYVGLESVRLAHMLLAYRRLPPRPDEFSAVPVGGTRAVLRDLSRFAVFGTLNRLFSGANKKIDNLIVGSVLGANALGFYSRAYALAATPMDTMLGMTIRSVVFPALAEIQDDAARFKSVVALANALAASLIMPLGVTIFVLAPEIVPVMFGQGWDEAIFPLQCLGLALGLRFGPRLAVAVGRALGQQRQLFFMNAAMTVVLVGAVWIGASLGGLNGASLAILGTASVHWFAASMLSVRLTQMPMSRFFAALGRPAMLSLAYFALLFAIAQILRGEFDIAFLTIICSGVGAVSVVGIFCLLLPNVFLGQWERHKLAKALLRLPRFRRVGKWLADRITPEIQK